MNKKKEKIELDDNTKDLISKTSTLLGVDESIIKEVYQYMLFSWFLKLSENNNRVNTISIPYLGHIGIRFNDEDIMTSSDSGADILPEVDTFIVLNDNFKKLLGEVRSNKNDMIANMIKSNIRPKLLEDILSGN